MKQTLTANGSTDWAPVGYPQPTTIAAQGEIGGGTLTLEWSLDGEGSGVTAIDHNSEDIALTASGIYLYQGTGIYLRWVLSGATDPEVICMISN